MPVYKTRKTPVKQSAAPAVAPSTPEATTAAVDSKQTGGFLASLWTGTKNFFSSAKASIGTAFAATGTFIAANWAPIVIGLSLLAVVIGIAYYNGWIGKAVDTLKECVANITEGKFGTFAKDEDGARVFILNADNPKAAQEIVAKFKELGITEDNYAAKTKGYVDAAAIATTAFAPK